MSDEYIEVPYSEINATRREIANAIDKSRSSRNDCILWAEQIEALIEKAKEVGAFDLLPRLETEIQSMHAAQSRAEISLHTLGKLDAEWAALLPDSE